MRTAGGTANKHSNLVVRIIEERTSEQRQAIEIAFFGGLTHSETANKPGQPLGALPPDEWASFKLHLEEGCLFCRSEFESFRRVADQLGFTVLR